MRTNNFVLKLICVQAWGSHFSGLYFISVAFTGSGKNRPFILCSSLFTVGFVFPTSPNFHTNFSVVSQRFWLSTFTFYLIPHLAWAHAVSLPGDH